MATSLRETTCGSILPAGSAWRGGSKSTWWSQRREASLNWLALGVLLAAWNASDDDAEPVRRRPEALRRYSCVSVRAAALHSGELRAAELSVAELYAGELHTPSRYF